MDDKKRIKDLKKELKMLESKQKKKEGIFKSLGRSTGIVFKSLGNAGRQILRDPMKDQNDKDEMAEILRRLPA